MTTTPACRVCEAPISGHPLVITLVDDDGVDRAFVCSIRCANVVANPGESTAEPS